MSESFKRSVDDELRFEGRVIWVTIIAAIAAVFGVALVSCGDEEADSTPSRPMPCAEDEVYVWHDYPTEAICVSNTDHGGHAG